MWFEMWDLKSDTGAVLDCTSVYLFIYFHVPKLIGWKKYLKWIHYWKKFVKHCHKSLDNVALQQDTVDLWHSYGILSSKVILNCFFFCCLRVRIKTETTFLPFNKLPEEPLTFKSRPINFVSRLLFVSMQHFCVSKIQVKAEIFCTFKIWYHYQGPLKKFKFIN